MILYHSLRSFSRSGLSFRMALPRCDIEFFSSGDNWATVFFKSGTKKIGSYPKPFIPISLSVINPSSVPCVSSRIFSGLARQRLQINLAVRFSFGTPLRSSRTFAIFRWSINVLSLLLSFSPENLTFLLINYCGCLLIIPIFMKRLLYLGLSQCPILLFSLFYF